MLGDGRSPHVAVHASTSHERRVHWDGGNVIESFYDLLTGDSEGISDSDSSRGSHHPSRKCFMVEGPHRAETPKGNVANVHEEEVTPPSDPNNEAEAVRRARLTHG
jgi:hypothetical protein